MNSTPIHFSGPLDLAIVLIGLALVILWLLLPFAVFGIKGRLDRQLEAQREILAQIRRQAAAAGLPTSDPTPAASNTPARECAECLAQVPAGVDPCPSCGTPA